MAGCIANALLGQVHTDRQIRERSSLHSDRIAENQCSGRDFGCGLSFECKRTVRTGLDRSATRADSDVCSAYGERFCAELIGKLYSYCRASQTDVHDVAIGGVSRARLT